MSDLQTQVLALAKLKPKDGESAQEFTKRVADKLQFRNDEEKWASLPENVQAWSNDIISAADKDQDFELLDLPEAEPQAEEPDAEAEAEPDPEEAEVEAEEGEQESVVEAKSAKKANGKKPVKAKPVKAEKKVAAPKVAKPAKPAKVAKVAKAPKTKGESRGRKPLFSDDGKIKIIAKENPHREGTIRDKAFKKIKSGMTVAEAVKAGASRQQVWSLWKREVISVS